VQVAKIKIDKDKCKGCLLCISFCPKGLIKKSKELNKLGVNFVEFSRQAGELSECLGCMMCAVMCPDCCIEVWE